MANKRGMNMKKRLVSLLMSIVMMCSVVPVGAIDSETTEALDTTYSIEETVECVDVIDTPVESEIEETVVEVEDNIVEEILPTDETTAVDDTVVDESTIIVEPEEPATEEIVVITEEKPVEDQTIAEDEIQILSEEEVSESAPTVNATVVNAPVAKASNVASTGKIKITWNAVSNAVKYKVYRSTSEYGTYSLMNTVTGTSMINKNAVAGNYYYYYVVAIASDGTKSVKSNIVGRTCDLARPTVTISSANTGKPKLTWSAVSGAVKYKIYRSKTGVAGSFSVINTVTGTSTINKNAEVGVLYYYKVKAIASNTNANSALTTAQSKRCVCATPTATVALDTNTGKPKITWNTITGAGAYEIYYSTTETGTYQLLGAVSGTSLLHTTATTGTRYYYKVQAVVYSNPSVNSGYSTPVSITASGSSSNNNNTTTTTSKKMVVTASTLNVRSGPGTDYTVCGTVYSGDVVTVTEEQNGFSKISNGWVSSSYLTPYTGSTSSTTYSNVYASYTTYSTSAYARDNNLAVACRKINGIILAPGESFSFNGRVGQRTAANGYMLAPIIVGNEYSSSYGGGVCQVSTTLFNAALLGNLQINARSQHTLSVSYVPKGRDAMVNWGTNDFIFTNNSNYSIKINAYASGGAVTISFMTRESGVSPSSSVSLNVAKNGDTYTIMIVK